MPSQPAWFHRLDEILSDLRSMTSTHLDRAAVEKLFRVRQRRARQIMAGLEGLRVGNAAAVSREALIARLERPAAAGVFQWEGNRRTRVVEALDLARRQLAAQHVRIPAAVDVCTRLLGDLSASQGQMEAQRSGVATMETALPRLRGHGVRVAMERKPGVFRDHVFSVRDSSSVVDACHASPGRARR